MAIKLASGRANRRRFIIVGCCVNENQTRRARVYEDYTWRGCIDQRIEHLGRLLARGRSTPRVKEAPSKAKHRSSNSNDFTDVQQIFEQNAPSISPILNAIRELFEWKHRFRFRPSFFQHFFLVVKNKRISQLFACIEYKYFINIEEINNEDNRSSPSDLNSLERRRIFETNERNRITEWSGIVTIDAAKFKRS